MSTYLVQANAKWIEWAEHPHGKQPDLTSKVSRELNHKFEAENVMKARKRTWEIFDEFCADLPKKKIGGLAGTHSLEVTEPTLAKVIRL